MSSNVKSPYSLFATDKKAEKKGIRIDYGSFVVTIGRAGGGNTRYNRLLEAKTKPFRRQIETETLDTEVVSRINREVTAEALIFDWETDVSQEGDEERTLQRGVVLDDGEIHEPTVANLTKVLKDLPDLLADLMKQANNFTLFREELDEADSKN